MTVLRLEIWLQLSPAEKTDLDSTLRGLVSEADQRCAIKQAAQKHATLVKVEQLLGQAVGKADFSPAVMAASSYADYKLLMKRGGYLLPQNCKCSLFAEQGSIVR